MLYRYMHVFILNLSASKRILYYMAGNFRGVLIFVIFVIDLRKFYPRKLMPTVSIDEEHGQKHRGSAATAGLT
jgi:hypothetical protein